MRSPLAIVGVMGALLVVGLVLLSWLSAGKPKPPEPDPEPVVDSDPPPKPVSSTEDPVEERIRELERFFERYRIGVTQMSGDMILEIFASDFEGDTLFRTREGTVGSVPGVKITTLGPDPIKRDALPDAIKTFFARIDVVTHFVTHVADADEDTVILKTSFRARVGEARLQIQEKTRIRMANGKVASMERLEGRHLLSVRDAFSDVTEDWGLSIQPDFPCQGCAYQMPMVQLGGVATADYNGDGRIDLFTVGPLRSRLFENTGSGFKDVTKEAGLGAGGATGLWWDYDNDGKLDLALTAPVDRRAPVKVSAVRLYRNLGDGTFKDVTQVVGLQCKGAAYTACAADIDLDGDLDLYIGRYGQPPEGAGVDTYGMGANSYINARNGDANLLFRNNGDGTFEEIAGTSGVADTGWTLATGFHDADGDRDPDLFVINDFGKNAFYRNRGDGTFEDASDRIGESGFGMGIARGDYDNDGDVDVYISNMASTAGKRITERAKDSLPADVLARMRQTAAGNTLLNNADGTFENVSKTSGTWNAGWAWGCVFSDYDNDGRLDLYVANGFVTGRTRTDL